MKEIGIFTTTFIPLALNPPHCTLGGTTIAPDHVTLFAPFVEE